MSIKYDPINMEAVHTNTLFLKSQFVKLGRDYLAIIALMKAQNFQLFDMKVSLNSMKPKFSDLITWRHLLNNYFAACKSTT